MQMRQASTATAISLAFLFALRAGKSVRWVADQLGHADPPLTLRVYAHAIPGEERDLSFAEFGDPGRPHPAPNSSGPDRVLATL